MTMELIVIALHGADIVLVDMKTGAKVSGPYSTYQEAVHAARTRA